MSLVWRPPCRCALVGKRQQCSMQGTWPAINRSVGKRGIAKISKGRCGTWEVRSAPQVVSYEVAAYRCRMLSASATMRARPVGLVVYNQRCAATERQRPILGCVALRPHPNCTEPHRLVGCEAIPIWEQGTSAAVVLVAGLLRHGTRPGISQLAAKAIITEQHVGDACAFS